MNALPLALLLVAHPAPAQELLDRCALQSSVADVQFTLALKDHAAVFREGEIIPLVLSLTSTSKDRYVAGFTRYDRSGRVNEIAYCVSPEAPDPLESYPLVDMSLGGPGPAGRTLDTTPLQHEVELNEWRTLRSGHYRVYATGTMVNRKDGGPHNETMRSNVIEIEVTPAGPQWQSEQLRSAVRTLADPGSAEEGRHALRVLRFLNTRESIRELARRVGSPDQDALLGLYGSPYRQAAIDALLAELAAPDHPITSEFLSRLVEFEMSGGPRWPPPGASAEAFWQEKETRSRDLTRAATETAVEALARKTGSTRAITLHGLLAAGAEARPALLAAWAELPVETQQDLMQNEWRLIAGPEMLPILRRMAAEAPPKAGSTAASTRNAALRHLFELDPAGGRRAIVHDLEDPDAGPDVRLAALLREEDRAPAVRAAVGRIANHRAREVDYELADRYAGADAMEAMRAEYEADPVKWTCLPALLRYFLRVAPQYGVVQMKAAMAAGKENGCGLLQKLGALLPKVEPMVIEALDDPQLAWSAAMELAKWGSAEAEAALWARLGKGGQREQTLATAIATGVNWSCPPEKLERLAAAVKDPGALQTIGSWRSEWSNPSVSMNDSDLFGDRPVFSMAQYSMLTEEQLIAKLAEATSATCSIPAVAQAFP